MKAPLWRPNDKGLLSYRSASNMDLRDGTIRPSPRLMASFDDTADGKSLGAVAPTIVHWTWNNITSPWVGKYKDIRYFRAGAWGSGDHALGAQVTDFCSFENGASAARVIICYGDGDFIDLADPWSDLTASTDVKLVLATMAGPDLYGVTNGGTYSTYMVSKCPAFSNPATATNWSVGVPVGSPMFPIIALRSVGGAPVAAKAEGLFAWENTESVYRNYLPWLENCAGAGEGLNGKGMFTTKSGVAYPTVDGGLFLFDGFNVEDISPKKYSTQHRDAPWLRARITAGCDTGEWMLVATAPWDVGWTQEHGVSVQKLDDGAYTDLTTNLTDGKYGTGGVIAEMSSGDHIIIGADVPFEAVYIRMGITNTDTSVYIDRPQYYDGSDWVDIGPAGSRAPDGTTNGGLAFAKSGFIRWRDFFTAHTSMKQVELNGTTKYWIRLPIAGGTISTDTAMDEVYILPSRPPISSDAALAYTGPDAAGALAHILAGRRSGSGWEWHDLFAIPVHAPIEAMGLMDTDTGQAEENRGTRLLMVSQFDSIFALMGFCGMPGSPVNENYADGMAMGTPVVYFLPRDFSDVNDDYSTQRKRLNETHIYGEYVDRSDTLTVLGRWDHDPWDTMGKTNTAPVRVGYHGGTHGLVLEEAMAYEDVDVENAGPRITQVYADFDMLDPESYPFDMVTQADAGTPETE